MSASRLGTTLIEMSIVVAISSVALMLSATTLVALFRVERQARSGAAHEAALSRLSSRFRADVHAAVAVQVANAVDLTLPGGTTIRYAVASPEITREVSREGAVVHRDAFVLAPQVRVSFSGAGDPLAPLVRLSVEPAGVPGRRQQVMIRPTTIAAALNLHHATHLSGGSP